MKVTIEDPWDLLPDTTAGEARFYPFDIHEALGMSPARFKVLIDNPASRFPKPSGSANGIPYWTMTAVKNWIVRLPKAS